MTCAGSACTGSSSASPGTHTYTVTADDLRVAIFYTELRHRLLGLLLAVDSPPPPNSATILITIDHAVARYIPSAPRRHSLKLGYKITHLEHQEGLDGQTVSLGSPCFMSPVRHRPRGRRLHRGAWL